MNGPRLLIYLLFFASGASGLVYEVVWVRQFGLLFGSTVYSAAVVTSIYMTGLGLGGYFAGRWVDGKIVDDPRAPVRAYGFFELGIAIFASVILLALPSVATFAAESSAYVPAEYGWYRLSAWSSVIRYGSAILMLTPITLLMGGTLTLLIRHLVGHDLSSAGRHIGVLYGINTAGAAIGCLLTDTSLVPLLGLARTQLLAIGLNLFAAAGALILTRSGAQPPKVVPDLRASVDLGPAVAWISLAIGLSGFAAMAMQILWFRHLVSLLGSYRPVFSILLTVILIGIWLGALLGGFLSSRTKRPGAVYATALAGFSVWALGGLWLVDPDPSGLAAEFSADPENSPLVFYRYLFRSTAWVVGPPALLSGMAFPLANAVIQRTQERIGERAGLLYLSNTVGGVLGSLLTGFWLLPQLGIQHTATVIACTVLVAVLVISHASSRSETVARPLRAISVAAVLIAILSWSALPHRALLDRAIPNLIGREEIIAVREGINETIAVTHRDGTNLRLLTNGHSMSSTTFSSQRYMRAFAHVPLFLSDEIENVMVMCFGVGNTADALLLNPSLERLDVVDLSSDILEHSKYFEAVNGRPLDDPRVRVHVNDARQHLRMNTDLKYDLITGEPPPIAYAGVTSLYTRDFYELAKARLRPGGFITYWMPMNQIGESVARSAVAAFLEVFPGAVLLSGYRHELILVGRKEGAIEFDPDRMRLRLRDIPGLFDELRWISLDGPADIAAMLAATSTTLTRATEGHIPLTDDRPLMEYGGRALSRDRHLPADLFSVRDVEGFCPSCRVSGLEPDERQDLEVALDILGRYYKSPAFLEHQPSQRIDFEIPLEPAAERTVANSLYLQQLVGIPSRDYFRTGNLLRHGKADSAAKTLSEFVKRYPSYTQGHVDLGDIYRRLGRMEDARREFDAARGLAPNDRRVVAGLSRLQAATGN